MNQVAIKVWNINYEFIIKNYLDPSLWDKEWTVFAYKNITFTLMLDSIDIRFKKIEIRVKMSFPEIKNCSYIWGQTFLCYKFDYFINNETIDNLKKDLRRVIINLIKNYEDLLIMETEGYQLIIDYRETERDKLRKIANDYLDENNVTNEEIRSVYIDYYVDDNETIDDQLIEYKYKNRYIHCPNLYLVFANVYKDDKLKSYVKESLNENEDDIETIMQEVAECVEHMETVEWEDEMKNKLEDI